MPPKAKAGVGRKRIATFGRRGALVRVIEITRGRKKYLVQWGPKGAREQESYPWTPEGREEALSFAEGFVAEQRAPKAPTPAPEPTTDDLWEAYKAASWPTLRPRSRVLYAQSWRHWQAFFGRDRLAGSMMPMDAYRFRAALEEADLATRTQKGIIDVVRIVYNFGERTELIAKNRWHQYLFKVAKEKRTQPRAEYTQEEFLAIWRQWSPTLSSQWRAYVATGLLGIYGGRQTATLGLDDADIDEEAGTITYRPELDKQGELKVYGLLPLARELVAISRAWRARLGIMSTKLFPAGRARNKGDTYTIQSYHSALINAETRAGIDHIEWRAGHGFRRGLVGDLLAAGIDIELALKAIGDKDIRMARVYAIRRNARIDTALAERVATWGLSPESATEVQPTPENANADRPGEDNRRLATLETSTT